MQGEKCKMRKKYAYNWFIGAKDKTGFSRNSQNILEEMLFIPEQHR